MRACPACAEAIQEAAVKCRFCGSAVQAVVTVPAAPAPPQPARAPAPQHMQGTTLVVVLGVAGMLLAVVILRAGEIGLMESEVSNFCMISGPLGLMLFFAGLIISHQPPTRT